MTLNLSTLAAAVDARGEIVDASVLRAISAETILELGAGLTRNRAAWIRLMVADAIGVADASKTWAKSVEFSAIEKGLESLAVELAHAGVKNSGPAWEKEFSGFQTHVRNAFPCVSGATFRMNGKGKDIAPTKAYAGAHVFKTAARGQMRAAIGFLSTAEKADITDPVKGVEHEPGDIPEIPELSGAVPLSADTLSVPATLEMARHFQIVSEATSTAWSQGHAAGQASMAAKVERLYAEITRLSRALDAERSKVAAMSANHDPAVNRTVAKGKAKA